MLGERYEPHPMRLGGILYNYGLVTQDELGKALAEQDRSETKLGKILLRRGTIQNKDLVFGLKIQTLLLMMGLATALTCMQSLEGNQAFAGKKGASELSVRAIVPIRSELTILYQTPAIRLTKPTSPVGISRSMPPHGSRSKTITGQVTSFCSRAWAGRLRRFSSPVFCAMSRSTPRGPLFTRPIPKMPLPRN